MDDSKQKNTANEDSVSIYMSFTDDTMMSSTNTAYNTMESVNEFSMEDVMSDLLVEANKTLEAGNAGAHKENAFDDHFSPLRPFDKNLLNQLNGKCSTPSKDQIKKNKKGSPSRKVKELEVLYLNQRIDGNKENTRPDLFGDGTHLSLSSMLDSASSKTLLASNTTDEESCSEDIKEYIKKQSEMKNKRYSKVKTLKDFSDLEAEFNDKILLSKSKFITKNTVDEYTDNPEELKSLIDDMLKLNVGKEKTSKASKVATGSQLQVRSSLLPTAGGEKRLFSGGLKQRMSVVKTALNSPTRKMANRVNGQIQRRSVMPPGKPSTVNYRPSMLPTAKPSITSGVGSNVKSSQSSNISNEAISKAKLTATYNCLTCGVTFRVKSLLDAHKRGHEVDENPPGFVKKTLANNSNAAGNKQQSNGGNQCKYCDKKFALQRALHIHLMQNCTKIPPSEQRKLEFTELDHVEKALLPVFPCTTTGLDALASVSENDLIGDSVDKIRMDPILEPVKTKIMPPPVTSSTKKSRLKAAPHAGVIRTPTKNVPCHICKQSFKSILDYTNHSLAMHSTNPKTMLAKHEQAQSAVFLTKK